MTGPGPADLVRTPGSHVTRLGGRDVHLLVQPGQGPPVVLLGGCAVPSYAFRRVVAALTGRWTVALDRPGLVETAWPGHLPTLAEEVGTLAELVDVLGEPAVVVAHSMAGPHAEALVRRHPGTVRGLVLLDASVERSAEPPHAATEEAWLRASRVTLEGARFAPVASAASVAARVMVWGQSRRLHLANAQPPRAREVFTRPDSLASVVAEQAAYASQLADLQDLIGTTTWPEDLRSLVLTAGTRTGWVRKQQVLADRLGARQVVVDDSRHLMMVDRPDVVVDAILSLVGERDAPAA
ncbi:alpha/beta fold hydrolase [Microlunatus flavus]|uniref:Pimeloyl-ACP methyl ester carboxylesterase n=1 Tax=Microlunatus flavus TaxID=1036181 RepID=A0A1H9CVE6_9ACTN|nr:alpha/beta hydrolase [Microlunatus flavus]SEQ05192.1 Pimeloyl-ACP methyl ester carboxylesterase [Microlunatus flavus]